MGDKIVGFAKDILKSLALGIIDNSYWLCLATCLLAIILYVSGQRKAGKYISISIVVYVLLQALKGVVK